MDSPENKKDLPTGKYVIPGEPISLARARHGQGRVYDAQKNLKLVSSIYLQQQHDQRPLYTGAIEVEFHFYFKYPKKRKVIDNFFTSRPDTSNLVKYYEDIGTSILWHDDCIIVRIIAEKHYSDTEYTEFIVRTLRR